MARAPAELLRQGTVLTWSALEVLAQDLFVAVLNARPALTVSLIKAETARRYFSFRELSIEVLAEVGFNVSDKMGEMFARERSIDNVAGMKAAFLSIAPDCPRLRDALAERELWTLNQRRNLIVHRRGLVDAVYIANTGDVTPVGSQLRISPTDLERYIVLVSNTGIELLAACTSLLDEVGPET